jgi:hypothetical protein
MTTRSLGLLYVFRSRLIVAATLLLAFADTPTSGSRPKNANFRGGILTNTFLRRITISSVENGMYLLARPP